MRKIAIGIIAVLLIAIVCVYIVIPSTLTITSAAFVKATSDNVNTCLRSTTKWNQWWPQPSSNTHDGFAYSGYTYQLKEPYRDGAAIEITDNEKAYTTRLLLIPYRADSVAIQWSAKFKTSLNPVVRVMQYYKAFALKNNMDVVLKSLRQFAGKTENIYGFSIQRTTFTDTILVATRFTTVTYPSIPTIYAAINRLKAVSAAAGAREKDAPMLNVKQADATRYETMVAICVDKEIETTPAFFVSRMVPMKDRFLKTEVTGGPYAITRAHEAVKQYMEDHFLSQPAIPFEILITDRAKETDTSKWRTTIFYPSM